MRRRGIRERIEWLGVIDWNRRLFDSLIPLPDGTSYNAYLVRGSEKTALLDTADTGKADLLMMQLEDVPDVAYVVVHHVEQDHSGAVPAVLARYPEATVLCTPKAKDLIVDHLHVAPDRIRPVADGEKVSLGDRTLEFLHIPWVHWPETMATYVPEERMLFPCDLFGSHLATSDLFVTDPGLVHECAKRYYAEIMMPFRNLVRKHLDRLASYKIDVIAPSHGPMYDRPAFILEAYRDWTGDTPRNEVVIPYISMHGSTERMIAYLLTALGERGVTVRPFDLACTDIGKLAISLVDAATVVIGTPTVHGGPHPSVFFATHLANALRPKLKFAAVVGSFGWGTRAVEQIAGLIPSLKVEILDPVLVKGLPRDVDYAALDALAETIASKHRELGLK